MYRFETNLTKKQIKEQLEELEYPFAVKWYGNRNIFLVERKRHDFLGGRVPVIFAIKGVIEEKNNATKVILSITPTANIKDFVVFFLIPTAAIMLYAGPKMGAEWCEILITLGAVTAFVVFLVNLFTRFSSFGRNLCYEAINMIKLQLNLVEK